LTDQQNAANGIAHKRLKCCHETHFDNLKFVMLFAVFGIRLESLWRSPGFLAKSGLMEGSREGKGRWTGGEILYHMVVALFIPIFVMSFYCQQRVWQQPWVVTSQTSW